VKATFEDVKYTVEPLAEIAPPYSPAEFWAKVTFEDVKYTVEPLAEIAPPRFFTEFWAKVTFEDVKYTVEPERASIAPPRPLLPVAVLLEKLE
jgi:hypothetical protein